MFIVTLSQLQHAIENAWTQETSHTPLLWTDSNPSLGQCAVTSLVVQDYLGGEILWSKVLMKDDVSISHYFNVIKGEVIDLTRKQFPIDVVIPNGSEKMGQFASTREYMLSDQSTQVRYVQLKNCVDRTLNTGPDIRINNL
jgi:hypothetical protein